MALCGSPNHAEGHAEISESDYAAAWDEIRQWRTDNPADRQDANKARTAVRQAFVSRLPPPRNLSSMWWIYLCATSLDWVPDPPISHDENRWLTWAFFPVINQPLGDRPVPGEDFDL